MVGLEIRNIDRGWKAVVSLLGAALAASACSGGDEDGAALIAGCAAGGCAALDAPCQSGAQCGSGLCRAGVCSAEPGPDVVGSGLGPTMPPVDGSGSVFVFADDLGPLDELPVCVDLNVAFERITPTVVMLIDRSGSMQEPFDNGRTRWETLVETLADPQLSLIRELQDSVRFGLALYSSNDGFGSGPFPRECPILRDVSISLGNFTELASLLTSSSSEPGGDTPTAESVEAITAGLQAFAEPGPKSIILATDGDPDTCEDPDAHDDDGSKQRSVAAVAAAYEQGITTHVISVGDEVTASHLKALAVAGSGGDAAAQAYTALDTQGLVRAFEDTIGSVRTCDFALEGRVAPEHAPRGAVLLDGEVLVFGSADGWVMPDDRTVRLQGSACEALQAGAGGVSMSFPCDAFAIVPR